MSVTFKNCMPTPNMTLRSNLRQGQYVFGPTSKCPIIITDVGSLQPQGVRLDDGCLVTLIGDSYQLLDVSVAFEPSSEG